jgi:L-fuconolactonase
MVIDGHQHFWDPARADYPWMEAPELARIRRAFGPSDLAPLLRANGIDATILVQCRSSIEETEEFLRVAAATPFVIGVVGWADLTDGAVDETFERLRGSPGGDRLVGIRHQVHDEPDPDWLLREDVQRGLTAVFAHDLTYDLLVRTRECRLQSQPRRRFRKGALSSITPPSRRLPRDSAVNGPIFSPHSPPAAMCGARFRVSPPRPGGTTGMRNVCFRSSCTPPNALARIV